MEKHTLHNPDGTVMEVYPLEAFKRETMAYRHDRHYKQFLDAQWAIGTMPADAIEALRKELGAVTRVEKTERRVASGAAPGAGRPRQELGIGEAKAAIVAAMFATLAKLERRPMPKETRELLDGMKRQLVAW